jgi:hypothetical protein
MGLVWLIYCALTKTIGNCIVHFQFLPVSCRLPRASRRTVWELQHPKTMKWLSLFQTRHVYISCQIRLLSAFHDTVLSVPCVFQRVGCDLKIGSMKKVDACGVCGGDGLSCAQPLYHWEEAAMSLCSVTCGGGQYTRSGEAWGVRFCKRF